MASPFKKIRGKQITDNEITGVHLYVTGSTAGGGQVPSYDAGSGGFKWITQTAAALPTISNKGMSPSGTTGNNADTFLTITTTPSGGSYVGASVNGVWYKVGNGTLAEDCYFATQANTCGGGVAETFATIVATNKFCWNGTVTGFDLIITDRVDFYYNI